MASWRDRVSEPAQEDLDGLLDTALILAEERLAARGTLHPFVLAVDKQTGATDLVAVPQGPADQARESGYRAVGDIQPRIRAAAVVTDVRHGKTGGDAIAVFLEHAEGVALSVLEPYRLEDGEIVPGDLEAHPEHRRIWTASAEG